MLSKDQEQNVAESSTAIQAGRDVNVIHTGLTYAEVKDIALDVFRYNFYQLAGIAQETARARAKEITEQFLSKLQRENPAGMGQANDPDFQYALFAVQKEYARTGDNDLGDVLINLLVDRSKQEQRGLLQIVLNESLNIAPKLTEDQLAILSVVFVFKHSLYVCIGDHESLAQFLDEFVGPFATKIVSSEAAYRHLSFTGCGMVESSYRDLESIFYDNFYGLFMKGFDEKDIANIGISIGVDPRFFMKGLNDPSKIQVRALNRHSLIKALESHAIPPDDRAKILQLSWGEMISFDFDKVREKCVDLSEPPRDCRRLQHLRGLES